MPTSSAAKPGARQSDRHFGRELATTWLPLRGGKRISGISAVSIHVGLV